MTENRPQKDPMPVTHRQTVDAFNEAARHLKAAMQASTLTAALDHAIGVPIVDAAGTEHK